MCYIEIFYEVDDSKYISRLSCSILFYKIYFRECNDLNKFWGLVSYGSQYEAKQNINKIFFSLTILEKKN